MDTFKDKQGLDELYSKGKAPWEVWRKDVENTDDVPVILPLSAPAIDTAHDAKPSVRFNGDDAFLSPVTVRPAQAAAGSR
jgi:hypothetical protein